MTQKDIDKKLYMLQEEIMLNFFAGNHSLIFEDKKEVKEFFKYIKHYDSRYDENFARIDEVKEVAWLFNNGRHNYQLEWVDEPIHEQFCKQYFHLQYGRFADYLPIKYSEVASYIRTAINAQKMVKEMELDANKFGLPLENYISGVVSGNTSTIDDIKSEIEKAIKTMGII